MAQPWEVMGFLVNTLGRILTLWDGSDSKLRILVKLLCAMKEVDVYGVCIAELLAGQLLLNSDYHRTDIVNYKFSCINFEKLALTPRKQLKAAQCSVVSSVHTAPPRCLLIIPPNHNLGPRCPFASIQGLLNSQFLTANCYFRATV